MPDVKFMKLAGSVPVIDSSAIAEGVEDHLDDFRGQLGSWGFMAAEIPGIGARVDALHQAFSAALASSAPRLADYSAAGLPQTESGGNHGFFGYGSEVPRLAQGTADPKEFIHVSGAMLDDTPAGARAMLTAFPDLAAQAGGLFETSFGIARALGDVVRRVLPGNPPELDLSEHSSILRVIHYRDSGDREVLAHEHSGIQMLGVQLPASEGGLQYILNDGTWVEPVIQGTDVILCNIGRMLTKASGQRVRPSTHRVHRSSRAQGAERWSSVLFVHPEHAEKQWVVDDAGDTQFLAETWGQFVSKGLQDLGLRPHIGAGE